MGTQRTPNGPPFHVAAPHRASYNAAMPISAPKPQEVAVTGRVTAEFAQILSAPALEFIARLHREFEPRRQELLARRAARQREFDAGKRPDFLADTAAI